MSRRHYGLRSLSAFACLTVFAILNALPTLVMAETTNSFFVKQGRSRGVVVFIHGLTGDARETWSNRTANAYWPDLIARDEVLKNTFDVYVVDYYSPLVKRAGTVEEVTEQVRQELVDRGLFRDYHSLVFVTHSMGGSSQKTCSPS